MPSRGKRVHLPLTDATRLVTLALLIEDRGDEEQASLLSTCGKLDRSGVRCHDAETWVMAALSTLRQG